MLQDWPSCIPSLPEEKIRSQAPLHVKKCDKYGRSGLFYAVYLRNMELLNLFIHSEAGNRDNNGMTALMFAAASGFLEGVRELAPLEYSILDGSGNSALVYAMFHKRFQEARVIINAYRSSRDFRISRRVSASLQWTGDTTGKASGTCASFGTGSIPLVDMQNESLSRQDTELIQRQTPSNSLVVSISDYSEDIPTKTRTQSDNSKKATKSSAGQKTSSSYTFNISIHSSSTSHTGDTGSYSDSHSDSDSHTCLSVQNHASHSSLSSSDEPQMLLTADQIRDSRYAFLVSQGLIQPHRFQQPQAPTVFPPVIMPPTPPPPLLDIPMLSSHFFPSLAISSPWKIASETVKFYQSLSEKVLRTLFEGHSNTPLFIPLTAIMASYSLVGPNMVSRLQKDNTREMYKNVKRYINTRADVFMRLTQADMHASATLAVPTILLYSKENQSISSSSIASPLCTNSPRAFPGTLYDMDPMTILPEISLSGLILLVHRTLFSKSIIAMEKVFVLQYARVLLLGHIPRRKENRYFKAQYIVRSILSVCPNFPECKLIATTVVNTLLWAKAFDIITLTLLVSICACFKHHRMLWSLSLQYFHRTLAKSQHINVPMLTLIRQNVSRTEIKANDLHSLLYASLPSAKSAAKSLSATEEPIGNAFLRFALSTPYVHPISETDKTSQTKLAAVCKEYRELLYSLADIVDDQNLAGALTSAILFRNMVMRDAILHQKGPHFNPRDRKKRSAYALESLASHVLMSIRLRLDTEGGFRDTQDCTMQNIPLQCVVLPLKEIASLVVAVRVFSINCFLTLSAIISKASFRAIHFFEIYSSLDLVAFNRLFSGQPLEYRPIAFANAGHSVDVYDNTVVDYAFAQHSDAFEQDKTLIPALERLLEDKNTCLIHANKRGDTGLMKLALIRNTFVYQKLFKKLAANDISSHTLFGETALMTAARLGNTLAVHHLIESGEATMQTACGMTALMFAVRQTPLSEDIIGLLLPFEGGMQDSNGNTALMHLCLIAGCNLSKVLSGTLLRELVVREGSIRNYHGMTHVMFAVLGAAFKLIMARSRLFLLDYSSIQSSMGYLSCTASINADRDVDSHNDGTVSLSSSSDDLFDEPAAIHAPRDLFTQSPEGSEDVQDGNGETFSDGFRGISSNDDNNNQIAVLTTPEQAPSQVRVLERKKPGDISKHFKVLLPHIYQALYDEKAYASRLYMDREVENYLINWVGNDGLKAISTCFGAEMFGHASYHNASVALKRFMHIGSFVKISDLTISPSLLGDVIHKADYRGCTLFCYCLGNESLRDAVSIAVQGSEAFATGTSLQASVLHKFMGSCYAGADKLCTPAATQCPQWDSDVDDQRTFCYSVLDLLFSQIDDVVNAAETVGLPQPTPAQYQRRMNRLCYEYCNSIENDCEMNPSNTCIICMDRLREICLDPCGHIVYCKRCIVQSCCIQRLNCPLCRTKARRIIELIAPDAKQLLNKCKEPATKHLWKIDSPVTSISSCNEGYRTTKD